MINIVQGIVINVCVMEQLTRTLNLRQWTTTTIGSALEQIPLSQDCQKQATVDLDNTSEPIYQLVKACLRKHRSTLISQHLSMFDPYQQATAEILDLVNRIDSKAKAEILSHKKTSSRIDNLSILYLYNPDYLNRNPRSSTFSQFFTNLKPIN